MSAGCGGVRGRLDERFHRAVRFERRDLRTDSPGGPFDLVLCRNLAYSYFDEAAQQAITQVFRAVIRTGGVLVVGHDECLPADSAAFSATGPGIYEAR